MTITAKYPGTCKRCGKGIRAGEQIEWVKGQGANHIDCAAHQPAPASPRREWDAFIETPVSQQPEVGQEIEASVDLPRFGLGHGYSRVRCTVVGLGAPYSVRIGHIDEDANAEGIRYTGRDMVRRVYVRVHRDSIQDWAR